LNTCPGKTIVLLCEPDSLEEHAASYAELVPAGDAFYIPWNELQQRMVAAGMTTLTVSENDLVQTVQTSEIEGASGSGDVVPAMSPRLQSLDAFRPIGTRIAEPQVAEAQRKEFFSQVHRWLRQGSAVHVFCNNDGERQRFEEIWGEYGFGGRSAAIAPASEESIAVPRRRSRRALPAKDDPGATNQRLTVQLGTLSRGFLFEEAKLVVITDAEIFGRYKVQRPRRLKSPHAQTSRSLLEINFADLQEGDYVVHLEHGIGRYLGLQMMPAAAGARPLHKASDAVGAQQECLVLEYAAREPDQPAPKLFVPVSEAHLVGKYVGAGKVRPPLNTLGGGRWQKAKEQAERAVRDLAAELLSIQAARASQPGHAFPADVAWQREFESAFFYEETPDQWKAILDTKHDMESTRPMDRLICGDVGYGKTEVAIRAAFKAVLDGRQVAVLVPTTVLAQQHFNTFRERMADYPIRIELLSRFRRPREQKKVIQDLATGGVDIVIGTHRLVQEDVAFKDLGLVVIDEEQRFGVMHKEKFKMLRKLVDVLTLSATPIPRTLHLALTGARDMSVIETPPQDRLPVETIVCEYDERVIRDAILREMGRAGQVFYLHNRVLDIETVAGRLRTLVPKARLLVGHGQMDADDLEEVMTKFVAGEADVLLSTTIIESGIDIPNANTIIIDRADRFGLSDLYQLRGRVGRYKHQAYAYLLIPRHARMLTDARKRISAIKQYSSLGSGFKIAMRDLEIRGAGNLLGAQQSGHITAVGFELYCQLLKQSVAALKGEKVKPRVDVQVRLDFLSLNPGDEVLASASVRKRKRPEEDPGLPCRGRRRRTWERPRRRFRRTSRCRVLDYKRAHAYLPASYVPDPRQRIELYRRFAEIMDEESATRLKAELRDRFGPLPSPVELLLQVSHLKVLAAERDIEVVESREDKVMLTRRGDFIQVGGRFPRLTRKEPRARLNEIKRLIQLVR
jgi:transcription-repair coupling factor (superfamily II helicase)